MYTYITKLYNISIGVSFDFQFKANDIKYKVKMTSTKSLCRTVSAFVIAAGTAQMRPAVATLELHNSEMPVVDNLGK